VFHQSLKNDVYVACMFGPILAIHHDIIKEYQHIQLQCHPEDVNRQ